MRKTEKGDNSVMDLEHFSKNQLRKTKKGNNSVTGLEDFTKSYSGHQHLRHNL